MECTTKPITIAVLMIEKNVINDKPPYQRESGVWSIEKRQLFLDSLFNNYDVPKLYFHDLRGTHGKFKYSVIDGKQRLHAIWDFLDDQIRLADDFNVERPENENPPKGGSKFSRTSPNWQDIFKSRTLDVVLVQSSEEDDIEELFSRLNNGEPLTAAEKRNAKPGAMTKMIRDVALLPILRDRMAFPNTRYQHYEVAAKFLLIEKTEASGGTIFCDLKKKFLDAMVESGKNASAAEIDGLRKRVDKGLKSLARVFSKKDPLLKKQAYAPLYYLFVKLMEREYADSQLYSHLKKFLEKFHVMREQNLQQPEDVRDAVLIEFGRLMQQGTNDLNSLRERVSILRRYFLLQHPEVSLRDKKRVFTEEERLAIWILSGKQCAICGRELVLAEMQADHDKQWAFGGATSLKNSRALCENCNLQESQKVA
jgi:Protein of unknown function DUF262/HNH endonuclease